MARKSKVQPNGQKRKFRILLPGATASYAVAENSRDVRRRLEREVGAQVARAASVTAFADVPPASPTSRPRP